MKFLEFIQSIFVPTYMVVHRKMKIFIAILILLICSLIMSIPSTIYLNKMKYNELCSQTGYDILKYVNDDSTNSLNEFSDDELSTYNMIRFSDLKVTCVTISRADGISNTSLIEDSKEYVLKAIKPIYDSEGTYVSNEITYVHIVFDFTSEENDVTYDVSEKFNKIPNLEENRFGHVLLLFDDVSLTFKNSVDSYVLPNLTYYKNISFDFKNMSSTQDLVNLISDTYVPVLNFTYRMIGLFFVGLFTIAIAVLFAFVLNNTGTLKGTKEYINVASIASIPFTIFAFIFSFIKYAFCTLLFKWYAAIFGIYFFVIVIIINRRTRIE